MSVGLAWKSADKKKFFSHSKLGSIFILRKDIGVGPENGNFPLLYVVKMSLCRWVGGSKKPQNSLTYYKDGPLE